MFVLTVKKAGVFSGPLAGQEVIVLCTNQGWYFQGDTGEYVESLPWCPAQNHAIGQL